MRRTIVILGVCSLLGLVMVGGCDQRVNTASDSIPNPVATIAHSVTGDGWVTVDGTSTAQATVMVSQTNDGRVDGMFELEINRNGESGSGERVFTIHKVTCLNVEGKNAWIRSEIVFTSHPQEEAFKVGAGYITLIRDFGENGTDIMHPTSLSVFQRESGSPQISCSDRPWLPSMETTLSGGDYQVR
jgi:hypothetical protein